MAKRRPVKAGAKSSPKSSPKGKAKGKPTSRASKAKDTPTTKILAKDLKEYQAQMKRAGVHRVANVPDSRATVRRWLSTQSLAVDTLLDGGVPLGKVIEVRGPPHVGKSTFLDHIGAQAQKEDGLYALADTELSRVEGYSARIGVDVDAVQYLEWEDSDSYIENVVNAIYESIKFWKPKTSAPIIIGWDALGSTASQDDIAKGLGSDLKKKDGTKRAAKPGAAAKAMRMAMRQIAPIISGTNIGLIILNHEYEVVNMMGAGPKRKPYAGQGLTFAASVILNLWPSTQIKDSSGKILGREVRAYLDKDRIGGKTNQNVTFALLSGVGIDNTYSIFADLKASGVIVTNGSWSAMNLDGEQISFQGWNGLAAKCREDETLFPRLVKVYRAVVGAA